MAQDTLKGLKVAILVTDGFETDRAPEPACGALTTDTMEWSR